MLELFEKIGLTILGIAIGFGGNYFLAVFNARSELKKEIAMKRATYYMELWRLCEFNITTKESQIDRYNQLKDWYTSGGGLLLPFQATNRLLSAIKLLKNPDDINPKKMDQIRENLTWLRTEMKYEVGSYSRREANTQLPSTKETV